MATTTLKAIIDRVQAICEGTGLAMTATRDAFSHDRQPAGLIVNTYWIEDAGMSQNHEATANAAVRIDRLTVWFARKVGFAGQTEKETAETTINTLERRIVADGSAQGFHARLEGRRVTRPGGKDIVIASAVFSVDYDFDLTVT